MLNHFLYLSQPELYLKRYEFFTNLEQESFDRVLPNSKIHSLSNAMKVNIVKLRTRLNLKINYLSNLNFRSKEIFIYNDEETSSRVLDITQVKLINKGLILQEQIFSIKKFQDL